MSYSNASRPPSNLKVPMDDLFRNSLLNSKENLILSPTDDYQDYQIQEVFQGENSEGCREYPDEDLEEEDFDLMAEEELI